MRQQRVDEVTRLVQSALPGAAVAVRPSSICDAAGVTYAIASADDQDLLIVLGVDGAARDLEVTRSARAAGVTVAVCRLTHGNAETVRKALPFTAPRLLGRMDATVGLGDRLGCAGPGHIAAIRRYRACPVLAQQSVRELTLTGRTFPEVLDASTWAVLATGYREPWGADGDHLKTEDQVRMALSAGLTMITADVSEHLHREAASMSEAEVLSAYEGLDAAYRGEVERRYLASPFPLVSGGAVRFTETELRRIVLLYRDSLEFAGRLYRAAVGLRGEDGFDFELSIDETDTPTTAQAHLFMGLESQRIGISLSSLAPRFVGEFQKAVDYIGAVREFEQSFAVHAEIAATLGYRISVHSGSDKFSVFPAIGRLSHGRFHIKTAGTSWLEALRVAAARDPALFRDLYAVALERYGKARALYHVTPNMAALPAPADVSDSDAPALLDDIDARRVLHITYGEILGVPALKTRLFGLLRANADAYEAMLAHHIGRHLELLGVQLRE